jgi:hypothetical protein
MLRVPLFVSPLLEIPFKGVLYLDHKCCWHHILDVVGMADVWLWWVGWGDTRWCGGRAVLEGNRSRDWRLMLSGLVAEVSSQCHSTGLKSTLSHHI